MWKRDQQILDVYGIKSIQSKDDSLIGKTPSLYKLPSLSHSQPSLTYTRDISSSCVYQGNEFDVFSGKQQVQEESTIEEKPHAPKVLKRTSIDYLINNDNKKRRLEPSSSSISLSNDNSIITNPSVFIKSTAPANTPANFFMSHSEEEQEAYDLEYY